MAWCPRSGRSRTAQTRAPRRLSTIHHARWRHIDHQEANEAQLLAGAARLQEKRCALAPPSGPWQEAPRGARRQSDRLGLFRVSDRRLASYESVVDELKRTLQESFSRRT